MRTKMLYGNAICLPTGTRSLNYFQNTGYTEVPLATRSKDSPPERYRQNGIFSETWENSLF